MLEIIDLPIDMPTKMVIKTLENEFPDHDYINSYPIEYRDVNGWVKVIRYYLRANKDTVTIKKPTETKTTKKNGVKNV